MIRLYKRSDSEILYAEAWVHKGKCAFRSGVVGKQAEVTMTPLRAGTSDEDAIEVALRAARANGFTEIPLNEQNLLILSYKTKDEWGDAEDLEKRNWVEEILNERLGWSGNGYCDGGDIGSGEMSVFSIVVDVKAACETIFSELGCLGVLSDVTMKSRPISGEELTEHVIPEELDRVAPPTNQQEWEAEINPAALRAALDDSQMTDRKCRLYGVACCRRIWDLLIHQDSRTALEYVEKLADGSAKLRKFDKLVSPAGNIFGNASMMDLLRDGKMEEIREMNGDVPVIQQLCDLADQKGVEFMAVSDAAAALDIAIVENPRESMDADMCAAWAAANNNADTSEAAEQLIQCDLVRCIFGSPFVGPSLHSKWRTKKVVRLAKAIYESRDFSQMPTLKQRLIDAGCNDNLVLSHCDEKNHTRGCWVIDWCRGINP